MIRDLTGAFGLADVARFTWSGRNSQRARRKAALQLAREMRTGALRAHDEIHLVGHSHGGNVAICASNYAPHRVESLATLATPFLAPQLRSRDSAEALLGDLSWSVYAILLTIAAAIFPRTILFPFHAEDAETTLLLMLPWVFSLLLGMIPFAYAAGWLVENGFDLKPARMRSYRCFEYAKVPTKCFFYKQDEAYFALTEAQGFRYRIKELTSNFGRIGEEAAESPLVNWAILGFLVAGYQGLTSGDPLVFGLTALATSLFLAFLIACGGGGVIAFFVIATSFGLDTLRDILHVRHRVRRSPSGVAVVEEPLCGRRAVGRRPSWLYHSNVCSDAEVIKSIISCIARNTSDDALCPSASAERG